MTGPPHLVATAARDTETLRRSTFLPLRIKYGNKLLNPYFRGTWGQELQETLFPGGREGGTRKFARALLPRLLKHSHLPLAISLPPLQLFPLPPTPESGGEQLSRNSNLYSTIKTFDFKKSKKEKN